MGNWSHEEGNRTHKARLGTSEYETYTWDNRNRLEKVTHFSAPEVEAWRVEYQYDYANRMTRRLETQAGQASVARMFVYDGEQIILETDETGKVTHRYLWGESVDQILADESVDLISGAGTTRWALTDHLNTVRDIATFDSTSSNTTIVDHIIYEAFGKVTSETSPANSTSIKFTGRYTDPLTGLQWNLNRWYDSSLHQWLSIDPILFEAGDPNPRRYVGNDPVNRIDPNGLEEGVFNDLSTLFESGDAYLEIEPRLPLPESLQFAFVWETLQTDSPAARVMRQALESGSYTVAELAELGMHPEHASSRMRFHADAHVTYSGPYTRPKRGVVEFSSFSRAELKELGIPQSYAANLDRMNYPLGVTNPLAKLGMSASSTRLEIVSKEIPGDNPTSIELAILTNLKTGRFWIGVPSICYSYQDGWDPADTITFAGLFEIDGRDGNRFLIFDAGGDKKSYGTTQVGWGFYNNWNDVNYRLSGTLRLEYLQLAMQMQGAATGSVVTYGQLGKIPGARIRTEIEAPTSGVINAPSSLPTLPQGYHYRNVGGRIDVVRNRGHAADLPPMHLENGRLVFGHTPSVVRDAATRSAFRRQLADNPNVPSKIRPWLQRGDVPPGFQVHHRRALFDGGTDTIDNMVLQGTDIHTIIHRYYRPGGQIPSINPPATASPY